jgi:uncharacterized repeat protein (TIGR03847 family)
MSESFDLPELDRFTTGTIGPPGQRVFYLQASGGGRVLSLRLEKGQVAALAQYLAELLSDLPAPADAEVPEDIELEEPVVAEWVVGSIGVVFDETRDRMLIRVDEIPVVDEAGEPVEDVEAELGSARFALTRGQVAGFVAHAAGVVASGRPACELCGRPKDPEGHMCIKTNGHKLPPPGS